MLTPRKGFRIQSSNSDAGIPDGDRQPWERVMGDDEKNNQSRVIPEERFKYIGFGVYPGKVGNIFKSEEERRSLVERVRAKLSRSQSEVRDGCTLLEVRLSPVEKGFLTAAAVALIVALFIPWFSGYTPISYEEIGKRGDTSFFYVSQHDERLMDKITVALKEKHNRALGMAGRGGAKKSAPVQQTTAGAADTAAQAGTAGGQTGGTTEQLPDEIKIVFVDTRNPGELKSLDDLRRHGVAYYSYNGISGRQSFTAGSGAAVDAANRVLQQPSSTGAAELIPGASLLEETTVPELATKGVVNDMHSISGIGAILAIGSYGGMVFSSGFALMFSGVLLVLYFISCVVLAVLNLYLLYGVKTTPVDEYVLSLKRMLRYNWIPVLMWVAMFLLSFVGASYGFSTKGMLAQLGDSYGSGAFIGLSSFGMYVTLAAFLIVGLKGKEI
jgi:hypothetical protein